MFDIQVVQVCPHWQATTTIVLVLLRSSHGSSRNDGVLPLALPWHSGWQGPAY